MKGIEFLLIADRECKVGEKKGRGRGIDAFDSYWWGFQRGRYKSGTSLARTCLSMIEGRSLPW